MTRQPKAESLAARGSLQVDALADLVALRKFLDGRDRAIGALLGQKLDRSYLREELLRLVVIEFGFDRLRTIAYYQRICAHLGSPASVRGELHLLAELGLTLFLPGDTNRKAKLVGPSQKLIDWYSRHLASLMAEVDEFISARRVSR